MPDSVDPSDDENDRMVKFAEEAHALPGVNEFNFDDLDASVLDAVAWLKARKVKKIIKRRERVTKEIEKKGRRTGAVRRSESVDERGR
jgi:hypothetical protein